MSRSVKMRNSKLFKSHPMRELTFDKKAFTKTFNKRVGKTHREGVREFARAIIAEGIPVETGMAAAALKPLGEFLHNVTTDFGAPRRKSYFHKVEGVHATVEAGEAASHYEIVDDRNNDESLFFSFEWDPGVKHFWQKRYYSAKGNKYTPGETRYDAAVAAYELHVRFFLNDAVPRTNIKFKGS